VGSVVLSALNYFDISIYLNTLVRPISWLLGLPNQVGVPLIFGVLRKELSLVMLGQALGSMDFAMVLTPVQMITYAVFVVFYVPCLATMIVIKKELGTKMMWQIVGLTTLIATLAGLVARGFALLIF
jgi:ferrous iron transport protein B